MSSAISFLTAPESGMSMEDARSSFMNLSMIGKRSPANGVRSLDSGLNPKAMANSSRKRIWKLLKSLWIASRSSMFFSHHSYRPSSFAPSLTVLYSTSLRNMVIEFLNMLPLIPDRWCFRDMFAAVYRFDFEDS